MMMLLPATTHSYLERSAESLREAIMTTEAPARYAHAHVAALRALHARAASEVKEYFQIGDDGSFTVDTALIAARPV